MRSLYVLAFLLGLVITGDSYSTEHDDFNMKAAVANIDTLSAMVGCFLDTNDCDAVATVFKNDIGDAIQKICDMCTDAQKRHFNVFLGALKEKLPNKYEDFAHKYDPKGIYLVKLEATVKDY